MRGWILFGVYLFTVGAGAEPFARYNSMPKRKRVVDAQASATVHLKIDEGENCTGVVIGPGGEALTNLHCVERCLTDAGVVQSTELGNGVTKREVRLNAPVNCAGEVLFFNEKSPRQLTVEVAKVFGPGFLGPRENLPEFSVQQPALFAELLNAGFEGYGDLVLLRIPTDQPLACARLEANVWAGAPTPVFNLAYPVVFRRDASNGPMMSTNDLFTIGRTLLFTRGEAVLSVEHIEGFTDQERDFIRTWMAPRTFLSSIDVEGGSSGSPVFNSSGHVIGLVRSTFNPQGAGYRPWMAEAVDIAPKFVELSQLVPDNAGCSNEDPRTGSSTN